MRRRGGHKARPYAMSPYLDSFGLGLHPSNSHSTGCSCSLPLKFSPHFKRRPQGKFFR